MIATLTLTDMAPGGEAVGRVTMGPLAGKIIFVPYVIAGEEAQIEIAEEHKTYARGRVLEILRPSPARVTPRCPHFGPRRGEVSANPRPGYARGCGGCQWQHIAYEAQCDFKTGIVREQLSRIGRLPGTPVAQIIPSAPWNYRNHVEFALDESGALCFSAYGSHDRVPIRECHILARPLTELFESLELDGGGVSGVGLRAGIRTGEKLIILEAGGSEPPAIELDEPISVAFRREGVTAPLIGQPQLHEIIDGRSFAYGPDSFFQVNTPGAEVLVGLVREFLAPRPEDRLLDAYCGAGIFGLSLASQVAHITFIEEYASALEDARLNSAGVVEAEFHEGRVQDVLPRLSGPFSIAVLDPPRSGCDQRVLAALATHSMRAIAYVSCDPATLARDARRLVDAGYRLVRVQPVDLFPQTYHVECVAQFERGN